jgi:hypothetical protein
VVTPSGSGVGVGVSVGVAVEVAMAVAVAVDVAVAVGVLVGPGGRVGTGKVHAARLSPATMRTTKGPKVQLLIAEDQGKEGSR